MTDPIDIRLSHPSPQALRATIAALRRAGFRVAFEHPPARASQGYAAFGQLDPPTDRWEQARRAVLASVQEPAP